MLLPVLSTVAVTSLPATGRGGANIGNGFLFLAAPLVVGLLTGTLLGWVVQARRQLVAPLVVTGVLVPPAAALGASLGDTVPWVVALMALVLYVPAICGLAWALAEVALLRRQPG